MQASTTKTGERFTETTADFGVRDTRGRMVGAVAVARMYDGSARERGQWVAYVWSTRDGKTFGAIPRYSHFGTRAEAEAAALEKLEESKRRVLAVAAKHGGEYLTDGQRKGRALRNECSAVRHVLVRHTLLNMRTGESRPNGEAWETKRCGAPVFESQGGDRDRGLCGACARGWEHPENHPAGAATCCGGTRSPDVMKCVECGGGKEPHRTFCGEACATAFGERSERVAMDREEREPEGAAEPLVHFADALAARTACGRDVERGTTRFVRFDVDPVTCPACLGSNAVSRVRVARERSAPRGPILGHTEDCAGGSKCACGEAETEDCGLCGEPGADPDALGCDRCSVSPRA